MNVFLRKGGRVRKGERERGRRHGTARTRCFLPFPLPPFLPLTLFLILALTACDSSFEPITQEPTHFFAVFGFLDTAADTQFVRVSPVRETLEPSSESMTALA